MRRAERDAGEHRIRRADGREERGAGDVAVGRVVDTAEVVGHGVGDVVAHAHRAGVVMRRAEIVAAILERGERGEALRPRAGRHRDHAVRAGEDVERLVAGEDERDLVGDRVHLVPCRAVVVGLGAAGEVLRRWPWRCRDGRPLSDGRNRSRSSTRSMKLSGLRGVMSPMPRIVMTTVLSLARSMSSRCSSVGIFLNSSASESAPSLFKPDAVIWKWNVRPLAALPFTSSAEHWRLVNGVGGRLAAIAALGTRMVRFERRCAIRFVPMRCAARPASDCWNVVSATRVVSTVPSAMTTALCPPLRGGASGMSDGAAVLPDAHAGHAHPIVGLRLGDELLHVAVRNDHQPLARVRRRPDPIGLAAREARGADQPGHGAEFVRREEARQGRGLHRERRFEFEKFAQLGFGRRVRGGQAEPVAQQRGVERRLAGIGVAHGRMVEQIGKREPGLIARGC